MVKFFYSFVIYLLACLFVTPVIAQNTDATNGFIPNHGQLADSEGKLAEGVKFYLQGQPNWYFGEKGWRIDLSQFEQLGYDSLTQQDLIAMTARHVVDVEFVDANPHPAMIAEEELSHYYNYYYGHCPDGVVNVHPYKKITYKNVWPSIDIQFYFPTSTSGRSRIGSNPAEPSGIEYDFIIHPGGNPNDIQLKYSGQDDVLLSDDLTALKIVTSAGNISETLPAIYQENPLKSLLGEHDTFQNNAVQVAHQDDNTSLSGNYTILKVDKNKCTIGFQVPNYNPNLALIIDPWATYYGGSKDDGFVAITVDKNDNSISLGVTTSLDFPTSNGAFQTIPGAEYNDAVVVKLDKNGNRIWATYFGGNLEELPQDITSDGLNHVTFTGRTMSRDFPVGAAPGNTVFQPIQIDILDCFIAKLNENGQREWATFYGGFDGSEMATGIATDLRTNTIFITGYSVSYDFPYTSTCGDQNFFDDGAFMLKFDAKGNRLWATIFHGSNETPYIPKATSVAVDKDGNAIMVGYSDRMDFPGTENPNVYQGNKNGGKDGFICKFDNSDVACNVLWSTFIGGSASDIIYKVDVDDENDIFITGFTSSDDFPVTSPAIQTIRTSGHGNAFISKLSSDGSTLMWSTFYGINSDFDPPAITIDLNNNAVVVGNMTNNLVMDPNGMQPVKRGYTEGFILQLDGQNGSHICSSYLGGANRDAIKGVAIDSQGLINVCGITVSTDFPVFGNTFQSTNNGNVDGFIGKYCFYCTKAEADIVDANGIAIPDTIIICKGDEITLYATGDAPFEWNTNPIIGGSQITVSPSVDTTYRLTSLAYCTQVDSITIIVKELPTVTITGGGEICDGENLDLEISFTGNPDFGFTYQKDGDAPIVIPPPVANPYILNVTESGSYQITNVKDNFCEKNVTNVSAMVEVHDIPSLTITNVEHNNADNTIHICTGEEATINLNLAGTPTFVIDYIDALGAPQQIITNNVNTYDLIVNVAGTYSFTKITDDHCEKTDVNESINVAIHEKTSLVSVTETCISTNDKYTLEVILTGGDQASYAYTTISPVGITGIFAGATWTSDEMNSGTGYEIHFFDVNNCNTVVVIGQKTCNCSTDAGAIATNDIVLCEDGQTSVIVTDPWTNDGNDAFEFVLHNGTATSIGTILDRNTTGTFNKNALACGNTYYITGVAANDNGAGQAATNDACFDRTAGVKVVWRCTPDISFEDTDFAVCDGSNISTKVLLTGSETTYDYILNANNYNNVTSPSAHNFVLNGDTTLTITEVKYNTAPTCAQAVNKTLNITALGSPSLVSVTETCISTNDKYTLEVILTGGDQASYAYTTISPLGITGIFAGATWTSDEMNSGTGYEIHFFDVNNCNTVVVIGQKTCNCSTDAGAIATNDIVLCEDGQTSVIVTDPWTNDGNDAFEFVLHNGTATSIGTILDRNTTGTFNKNALACGNTYYITGVAANDNGAGQAATNDACFDRTAGVKVVWRCTPDISFEDTDFAVCDGSNISTKVLLTGSETTYDYILNANNYNNVTSPSAHNFVLNGDTTLTITEVKYNTAPTCAQAVNKTLNITALGSPSLVSVTETCISTNDKYTLEVILTGGDQASYAYTTISPVGITGIFAGATWTSDEITSGTGYEIHFYDVNNCNTVVVIGQKTCNCSSFAGTVNTTPQEVCENVNAVITHNNDHVLDGNDVLEYILHDGINNPIGNVL
ncbi:MAG: hypothetical protein ACJAUV_001334, partial [Flavobacteriales bacterium]